MSMTIALIALTAIISVPALSNFEMSQKLILWPYEMKRKGGWHRFLSSGFVHGSFVHLGVNMFVLYSFGAVVEGFFLSTFGPLGNLIYLGMYLGALVFSDLPSYFQHRDNPYFRSLGASGAVAAVVFASILLFPTSTIQFILPPIPVNAVLFGLLYLAYSYYMDKKQMDNVGHSAHFFGAVFGFAFPIALRPDLMGRFIEQVQGLIPL